MNHLSSSPLRAAVYYSTAIFLLNTLGRAMGVYGLPGVALMQAIIFVGIPLFFAIAFDMIPLRQLFRINPLKSAGYGRALALGVLCWVMSQSFGFAIQAAVERLGGRIPQYYESLTKAPALTALIVGAIVPAICEEFAFRGYLQWNLGRFGPTASVILTGVLFGAMHGTIIRVLPLALLGIVWARAAQRAGSIVPGMVMHLTHNGIALLLTFYARAQRLPTATGDIAPPGVLTILVTLVVAAVLFLVCHHIAAGFTPRDTKTGDQPHIIDVSDGVAHVAATPAEPLLPFLLALLPGFLLYLYICATELYVVFLKG